MKDAIKFILEIIGFGRSLWKEYKNAKTAKRKKEIREALKEKDLDKLRDLILNRKPSDPE